MKIKHIIAVLVVLACLLFTGCSSSVSVYTTKVTDGYYNCGVDLFVAKTDIDYLESNSEGRSVENYLSLLASTCGVYENTTIVKDKDGNVYLSLITTTDSVKREEYSTKIERGLFFHKVEITFKNPLDELKKSYYNGISEKPQKGTDTYLVYLILNGEGNLQSFTDYFNVDKSIADDLTLNFLLKTRPFYSSSAPQEYVLSSKYFKWTSTMKNDGEYIVYTRYVANAWPWFLLALIVGGAVVVVLLIITKKSKAQPSLVDTTEIERIRTMKKSVPANARIVKTPTPIPDEDKVFEDDNKTDNGEENN